MISKGLSASQGLEGQLFLNGMPGSGHLSDPACRRCTPIASGYFTLLQLETAGVDEVDIRERDKESSPAMPATLPLPPLLTCSLPPQLDTFLGDE